MAPPGRGKLPYGWIITAAASLTLGLTVGLPYYNLPFFYDYFARAYGWSGPQITLGFPLAALPTVLIAPFLIHRFSARKLILCGSVLSCLALISFGKMGANIRIYFASWFLFAVGYVLSGPIPHQIIIAQWFRRNRGKAMGAIYVGLGLAGFLGSFLVKPLTEELGFHNALIIMGALILLACPVAFFVLRDRPAELGLYPDGDSTPTAESSVSPHSYTYLIGRPSFWLLILGSTCSIGAIGSVNMLMKLVFESQMTIPRTDPNFQHMLNSTWRAASMLILATSILSRVAVGAFSDRYSKKWVMTTTYFVSAATIPILLSVTPPHVPWLFATLFGVAMGADYMLIPLMAAEQFGVTSLARTMAIVLPANTIAQSWFPYFTSLLKQRFPSYTIPMYAVFSVAVISGIAIALLPSSELNSALHRDIGTERKSQPQN